MTFTSTRYENYAKYLKADLGSDGNFRLLSNGEIIDRHRQQIVVLELQEGTYEEHCYRGSDIISSSVFPALELSAEKLLSGKIF